MFDRIENAFQFHSLERFTFWQRLGIRGIAFSLYVFVKLLGPTMRFQADGEEYLARVKADGKYPIYTFWHDRSIAVLHGLRYRRIIVLISQSFDGEYTARCIQRFGFGVVKGSSSRGGVGGLVGMIRVMKKGFPTGFAVDGPRGPRYEVKMGPVLLAQKTGNPLLPFVIEFRSLWRLRSWDRLQVPKPFTRAAVIFGEPIYVAPKGGDSEREAKLRELQASLDELVKRGDEWRNQ